ncbi:MAG: GNAT family N-acetyltransferase [Ginsengibacter sp.]
MDKIFLRALKEEDAGVSWKWRNDPAIWKHTGKRPNQKITPQIELEWIRDVLTRQDEARFAICERDTGKYIGNVQLTDINGYDAQLHVFIGDKNNHGKGYGTSATTAILDYGLNALNLQSVYLDVKKINIAAIKSYKKAGFHTIFDYDDYHRMAVYKTDEIKKKLSVFVLTYNQEIFVADALDGILKQRTSFDFEVVIGDDYSTDGTRKILLEYALKFPGKMKLLFYPHNLSAPVNQHWVYKNCSGDYIGMCEGDDYWTDENKLECQVNYLESNPGFSISFHDIKVVDKEGNDSVDKRQLSEHKRDFDQYELLGWYIPTPTLVFKKTMNELPSYFLKSPNGDALLLSLLTQQGRAKYLANINSSVVRIHPDGAWSGQPVFEKINQSLRTKLIIFKNLDKGTRKKIYKRYIQFFEVASIEADNRQSRIYWFKYNFKYLQLSVTASHYGKALLVCRRMFFKIFSH